MDAAVIAKFLRSTDVLLSPQRPLSAYGTTHIRYHLISPVEDLAGKTRLREGSVVSERPLILTPEALRERFEGFGQESQEFSRWLTEEYRDLLRALEYRFRNKGFNARVLTGDPRAVAGRILEDLQARSTPDSVLIRCPDAAWSLALMKFTLDETARAFPGHVRTLEEHGLFDPAAAALRHRRRKVERLFQQAAADPSLRHDLGRKLKDYGLFSEYEDRFLSLFAR